MVKRISSDDRDLMKEVRAVIYARVSSESQDDDDKVSIREQIEETKRYCEERNYAVVGTFKDVMPGWSKNRPEFQEMLQLGRYRAYDVIVTWRIDRLARGIGPTAIVMDVVDAYDIGLESTMEHVDVRFLGIMASIAKIESEALGERSRMGRLGSARNGKVPNSKPPFGYTKDERLRPIIHPDEAKIVERIFRMSAVEDLTSAAIAAQLNEEGIAPPGNGRRGWSGGSVSKILSRTAYIGSWFFNKERQKRIEGGRGFKFIRTPVPREQWVEVPFPPIVSEDLWNASRARVKARSRDSYRNTRNYYLLKDKLFCEVCSEKFGGRTQHATQIRRDGKRYTYEYDPPRQSYVCLGMEGGGAKCRAVGRIRAPILDKAVWGMLTQVIQNPAIFVDGVASQDSISRMSDGIADNIKRAEKKLEDTLVEEELLWNTFGRGKISVQVYDRLHEKIEKRIKKLKDNLEDLHAREQMITSEVLDGAKFGSWVSQWEGTLDSLDDADRRKIVELLVDRVTLDAENRMVATLAVPVKDFASDGSRATTAWFRTSSPCRDSCVVVSRYPWLLPSSWAWEVLTLTGLPSFFRTTRAFLLSSAPYPVRTPRPGCVSLTRSPEAIPASRLRGSLCPGQDV